jgi:hypothetical protein
VRRARSCPSWEHLAFSQRSARLTCPSGTRRDELLHLWWRRALILHVVVAVIWFMVERITTGIMDLICGLIGFFIVKELDKASARPPRSARQGSVVRAHPIHALLPQVNMNCIAPYIFFNAYSWAFAGVFYIMLVRPAASLICHHLMVASAQAADASDEANKLSPWQRQVAYGGGAFALVFCERPSCPAPVVRADTVRRHRRCDRRVHHVPGAETPRCAWNCRRYHGRAWRWLSERAADAMVTGGPNGAPFDSDGTPLVADVDRRDTAAAAAQPAFKPFAGRGHSLV